MSAGKEDWTNDSDDIGPMDWATESETQEAKEELMRREAQDKKDSEASAGSAESTGTQRTSGREGRGRGGRGGRGARGGRGGRGGRPAPGKEKQFGVFMVGFPDAWREADVKKFFTTTVKETIAEDQFDRVEVVSSNRIRAFVYFKTEESFQKALKADKTQVDGKEVSVKVPYKSGERPRTGASRPSERRRPAAASGAKEKENPFGNAHANDTQMKTEREQIVAEKEQQEKKKAPEAAAAAPATEEGAAAAAAPAAAATTDGEAKPEEKPEAAKPAAPEQTAAPAPAPAAKPARSTGRRPAGKGNNAAAAKKAAEKSEKDKKAEETKKALRKQQKEREKKRNAEEAEKNRKEKTFNPFGMLSSDE